MSRDLRLIPCFRSAAKAYEPCPIGKLDDGAAGLKALDACGGFSIVQTPTDCAAPDRPTAPHEAVLVDDVAPMNAIPASIFDALTVQVPKGS